MQPKQIIEQCLRQQTYLDSESIKWDKINQNPRSFVAREYLKEHPEEVISLDRIKAENMALGEFAVGDLDKKVFKQSTPRDIARRLAYGKKIVYFGYGQGYDSDLIELAMLAGYQVCLIDISQVACDLANKKILEIWEKTRSKVTIPPMVYRGEIRSILLGLSNIHLDFDSVEVWYMCRTLSALSMASVKIVLQKMGESLSSDRDHQKNNRIVLTNPLGEKNPQRIIETSIVVTKNMIVSNIQRGAARSITVTEEDRKCYFERIYTSMIIKAE